MYTFSSKTLRVHVPQSFIIYFWPQSTYIGTTLGPKHILFGHMDPYKVRDPIMQKKIKCRYPAALQSMRRTPGETGSLLRGVGSAPLTGSIRDLIRDL